MYLSPAAVSAFQHIYQSDYNVVLTDEEALHLATSFVDIMAVVYRALPDPTCQRADYRGIMPPLTHSTEHP